MKPEPWNSFEPDLVTVLKRPPATSPNSALQLFVMSENSEMESCITATTGPVTLASLLSTPSTTKLLPRGRVPPTEPPSPVTPAERSTTFGERTARSEEHTSELQS